MRWWGLAGLLVVWPGLKADASPGVPRAERSSAASTVVAVSSAATAAMPVPPAVRVPPARWSAADWTTFDSTIRRAAAARLDTLPLGRAIVVLGRWFEGAEYRPGTLEVPGPERLVINLQAFDCVTYVEQVLALVRFARHDGVAALADSARARRRFEEYLAALRYREGRPAGYASRLHYFSEWLTVQAAAGRVTLLDSAIAAVPDTRPLDFMTTHAAAYRQLASPAVRRQIRAVEQRLSTAPARPYVPKADAARLEPLLQDGDVLAMTSALDGLDVAHVGFAVLVDGRPHLLNAPLVGKSVELSPLPLAAHLAARSRQTGVMVGRPTGW